MSEGFVLNGVERRGASSSGAASVREVPGPGMITVKGDLSAPVLAGAVRDVTGCAMPRTREILAKGDARVAWMAPDEVLIVVARGAVAGAIAELKEALQGSHALVADVSDMRAMFRIESGAPARETLAKLCPVDLDPGVFGPGEIRRTRLAQIAAAFWLEDDGFTLVCFRSVAQYAFDALSEAADPNARVGYFAAQ